MLFLLRVHPAEDLLFPRVGSASGETGERGAEKGLTRAAAVLQQALRELATLREEFWATVKVPGSADTLNQSLEKAGRVADFIELGELMCLDALTREESCGGHFREEHQYPDGECKRDDERFAHVAAWEYQGAGKEPLRNVEPLNYEFVKMSLRNYK
jgi:succinate dehydrogenase / fumarate reductase flavoprotein subunit